MSLGLPNLPIRIRASSLVTEPSFWQAVQSTSDPTEIQAALKQEQRLFPLLHPLQATTVVIEEHIDRTEKQRFLTAYKQVATQGSIESIKSPQKLVKVHKPEFFLQRIEALHDLRTTLDDLPVDTTEDQALKTIYEYFWGFYWSKLLLKVGALTNNHDLTSVEQTVLEKLLGTPTKRLEESQAKTFFEAADSFLWGRVKIGDQWQVLSPELIQFAPTLPRERLALVSQLSETTVTAAQVGPLAQALMEWYGFPSHQWHLRLTPTKTNACVIWQMATQTGVVQIPTEHKRPLYDLLITLAHEIEGHAVRYLACLQPHPYRLQGWSFLLGTGLLSEGAAVWAESQTRMALSGQIRQTLWFDYELIRLRIIGTSFSQCFHQLFTHYAEDLLARSVIEVYQDDEKYQEIGSWVFNRVLRSYRYVPTNSTILPTTKPLIYVEQARVTDVIRRHGHMDWLWSAPADLGIVSAVAQLGQLVEPQPKPRYAIAQIVGPVLKQELSHGTSIESALAAATAVLKTA